MMTLSMSTSEKTTKKHAILVVAIRTFLIGNSRRYMSSIENLMAVVAGVYRTSVIKTAFAKAVWLVMSMACRPMPRWTQTKHPIMKLVVRN